MKFAAPASLCLLALACFAMGDEPPAPEAQRAQMQKMVDELHYQQGEITLKDGLAKVQVPAEFRFLDGKDAATVLTKVWGNPPGARPLGMLLPAQTSPLDDSSWAVIITYEEDGHVKDDDAAKINYSDLLKQMKEGTQEVNAARSKDGYPAIELVGWAETPRYDSAAHKLHWAKELKFEGSDENTLNYNIRMLGRKGVLVLNAVSGMSQLRDIDAAVPSILSMVDFQEGHRYADFKPGSDKVATYGIAALIAGGVLAKGGVFKVLLVGLLAMKKFAIVAILGAGAAVKALYQKLMGGGREQLK